MTGTVAKIVYSKGFGFIKPTGGAKDVFFHCSALCEELDFSEQLLEQRVSFDTISTARGPAAANIRAAL